MIHHHAVQSQYTKASRVSILLHNPCKVCLKKAGWKELAILYIKATVVVSVCYRVVCSAQPCHKFLW